MGKKLTLVFLLICLSVVPAGATIIGQCNPADPTCIDPNPKVTNSTGTPIQYTWTTDPVHAFNFTWSTNGDNYFVNNSNTLFTNLEVTVTNFDVTKNYGCPGSGTLDFFTTCAITGDGITSITWTFTGGTGISGSGTGFDVVLNGFSSWMTNAGTQEFPNFTVTPSINEGGGGGGGGEVPEPASLVLLGSGLLAIGGLVRRRKQ